MKLRNFIEWRAADCAIEEGRTKITYRDIVYIVNSVDSTAQLAKNLGVSCATVRRVRMESAEVKRTIRVIKEKHERNQN
jgi:hypothetical protein